MLLDVGNGSLFLPHLKEGVQQRGWALKPFKQNRVKRILCFVCVLINAKVLRGFLLIIFVDKQENPSKSVCNQSSPLKAVCKVRLLVEILDEPNVSESQTFSP